ncbi:MAG: hypothetical protein LC776_12705, partial [Acidobacteria bacterium]|nr:hypothetical protein [Acidobacteriota bacterium]
RLHCLKGADNDPCRSYKKPVPAIDCHVFAPLVRAVLVADMICSACLGCIGLPRWQRDYDGCLICRGQI